MVLAHRLAAVNRCLVEARDQPAPAAQGRVFDEMVENIAEAIRYGPPM
jgi:hypothetical protein